ncbi:proliferation marker protein Ki-67 isoform X3 [Enhydra lutris kenyoni]|uniref:Proliferation marker protein Ki-67 isoform X3 n=1 Tax=Enhydra lutris kenyoni TaxID=391180 RepID=A0A2Y9JCI4_ENHLU|nr:proliferation marker protein Ki-67 isoform X3 [Enhydra lutris kenyoni]
MGPTGRLVTIKRSGVDGPHFPLSLSTCLFGRGIECDIRIQLPVVSKQHCKIEVSGQEAILFNFSSTNPTQVNGSVIAEPVHLKHGDVITIVDRSFRYENESQQNGSGSTECPGQKRKQDSLHQVSRSSFSSDPDGKVQDSNARSKLCEENVSGSPLIHVKNGKAASSDGPKDHAARKSLNAVHSSELPGENFRNAMDPTAGDFKEDSSVVLVSCHGELKTFPSAWCPENSENQESPFRELYESMKEEFDMKSGKENVPQSGKKSGSRNHRASENECSGELQDGTQVLVSLKSRPRSGRFTPVKADPALGEQGISQTEDRRKDEEALQTPKETTGPSIPPKEMTRTKTLVHHSPHNSSRKRRSEDLRVPSGSEPVNLAQRESFGTDNKTFTPRKFLTRNPTPTKVENAVNFGATPEKLFSKKRASVPSSVDVLATELETQTHTVLAPLPVQVERKIQSISMHQPEKVGATVGPSSSGFPGHSSVDSSSSGDSINKIEGTPLKRRRVSFGGRLKPELFDENLPPNTPLKRGETPRRSLVSHTSAVLKKIIKEYPQPSRKEDSSEIRLEVCAQDQRKGSPARNPTRTSPVANEARRRSSKVPSVSRGSASPHPTDTPKRGGRKSGTLPSKRASIDRSQHEILQRIYSRRRSGASEANLIVAKSWADVVKLGAKQTQAKVVKHGPQRQPSKRHKRTTTPKKPVSDIHSQFSTGHANSPCTIIIGKAHIEKVHVPARPYRMLNNLVFNKKIDFNEDLSGLTEMFKTPAKEKPQTMSLCPKAFSNSEDFIGKEFEVPNSGEKPPLCTSVNFGENVFHMTQSKLQEPSDHSPASPALRRPAIRVNTNIKKTPGSEAEPLKVTSSANRFRRSTELGNTQMPGSGHSDEEANTDTAENMSGRRLRKTPQRGQKPEGATEERESCFDTCEKAIKSEGSSEKMVAMRRSRRYSEQRWDPIANLTTLKKQQDTEPKEDLGGIQNLPQTPTHAQEPMDVGNKTTEKCKKSSKLELVGVQARMNIELKTPPQKVDLEEEPSALRKSTQMSGESVPLYKEPGDGDEDVRLFKRSPKQKVHSSENVTGSKRRSRTPKKMVQSLEDLAGLRELFQTPNHTDKPMTNDKTTKVPCKSPLADPVNTLTSKRRQLKTPPLKGDLEKDLRKPTQTPGESTHSHGEPGSGDEDIKLFKETPKQKMTPAENVTGSKRRSRTPKRNAPSLEDLAGLRELFQTPNHTDKPMADDKTTTVPGKSPLAEPVSTPTSRRRQFETPPQKVDLEKEPSALSMPTRAPGESIPSHGEPGGGDEDIKLLNRTPKQEVHSAENVTGSKRQSRTSKRDAPSLEDLAGLRELFQTPNHTEKLMADDNTTTVPRKSPLADPVSTPMSKRRRLRTLPQKVDLEEEPSALRKSTRTLGESGPSHREPGGGDEDIRLSKETPRKKLDRVENVSRSKKGIRTGKEKAQFLEDLVGFKELFQTPEHTREPTALVKSTVTPGRSPLAETVNTAPQRKTCRKMPQGTADSERELAPLGEPIQTPAEATRAHGEPGGGEEVIRFFKETPKQKMNPAENVTGSKRRSRTPKRNAPSLEDLAGLRELFRSPERPKHPVTDDKTTVPCKSPLADPVHKPMSRRRRLKTSPQKVDIKQEPSAPRKSTRTRGAKAHSGREAGGPAEDIELLGETVKREARSAENGAGSKRGSRTRKGNAPSLDLAGRRELSQTPEHTQDPVTDDPTATVSGKSPLADPVHRPASRRRQVKTLPRQAGVGREPSALRMSPRRRRPSAVSGREPAGRDGDVRCVNDTAEQTLSPAANGTLRKSRLRAPKEKAPPLEDLASSPEPSPLPDPSEEAGEDAGGGRAAPVHPPGGRKAVSVPQRSLRFRRATAEEDPGHGREPVGSGREGGASLPSKREGGTKEASTGTKRLRSATPAQDATEEKPPQKRRRAAPREDCDPPEPLTVKKRLRVVAEQMQLPGDPPRSSREATPRAGEAAGMTPSHQGRSLRSRRPNKTEAEETRPEPVVTATEKPKTKRSDKKPLKTSQETALQSPEDGAKHAASGSKARESRMCLRSARPTKMPSPDVAQEKQREKRVGVQEKKQEEEVRQPSDPMRLRSRKITVPPGGKTLESEPQQRVTRNAKRCAENIKKDDDNVCIKKLRTRSRQDNEDI